jgi:hypothetical protein
MSTSPVNSTPVAGRWTRSASPVSPPRVGYKTRSVPPTDSGVGSLTSWSGARPSWNFPAAPVK